MLVAVVVGVAAGGCGLSSVAEGDGVAAALGGGGGEGGGVALWSLGTVVTIGVELRNIDMLMFGVASWRIIGDWGARFRRRGCFLH